MKKLIVFTVGLLLSGGCASPSYYWYKPDTSKETLQEDYEDCNRHSPTMEFVPLGVVLRDPKAKLETDCMKSKGYEYIPYVPRER